MAVPADYGLVRDTAFRDLQLTLGSGTETTNPSPDEISATLASLDGRDDSFAILSMTDMEYVQTHGCARTGFVVEYQMGSIEQHFRSLRMDLPLETVDAIFRAYARRDPEWKSMTEWKLEDPGEGSSMAAARAFALGAIAVLILGGLLALWKAV